MTDSTTKPKAKVSAKQWLLLIVICLTNITVIGDNFIIPIANSLYETFSDNVNVVNYILTGPLFLGMIAGLIAGKMLEYVRKKIVLVICLIAYMLAAAFSATIVNPLYMAGMRTIVGFATGMSAVCAMSMVTELFPDEDARAKAMGFFSASMGLLAAIASAVAGVVAVSGEWTDVFKLYWVTLPIVILAIIFLPNNPAPRGKGAEGEGAEVAQAPKEKMNYGLLLALCGSVLVFVCVYSVPFMQISVYIAELGIGDEALAGVSASLVSICSFLLSTAFGFIYAKAKRMTITASYLLLAVTFLLMWAFPSSAIVIVCSITMGAAYGVANAYFVMRATVIAPPSQASFSLACENAALSFASFISTFFVTALRSITGIEMLQGLCPIFALILIVGFVISLVLFIKNRNEKIDVEAAAA